MKRLIISLTPEQHKWLKTQSAIEGVSMREYIVKRVFDEPNKKTIKAMRYAENGKVLTESEIWDDL